MTGEVQIQLGGNELVSLQATAVQHLFAVRSATHTYHLTTKSYEQHVALDTFYKEVTELTDRFAECAASRGFDLSRAQPEPPTVIEAIVPYMEEVRVYLDALYKEVAATGELQNIVAELLELTSQTLYRLSLS